ncbi:MAG: glycosyltransferase family 39 protein, partial [Ideonella sp.]|nr:glycosyltransferase family 39 protein [Ideonella sp.]
APSRPLLIATIVVVLAFTVLRFITAATLDLRTDEAYYWTWADQYVLSYLDHPPMVAWVERLGIAIFGNTPLGVRFGQLLMLPMIELILADIARRRTRSWNAALFVVLAMECTLNYGVFSVVVEPNLPLLLFTGAMIWALSRLDETGDARWWLAIGTAAGLAALSKCLVALLVPAVVVFLLLPAGRKALATPWPYAGAVLALAVFSPVLVWNAQHGWASFAFQGTRLSAGGSAGDYLARYALYEVLWLGPVLFLSVLAGTVALLIRGLRRSETFAVALAVAVLAPVGYMTWRSLDLWINQSWTWVFWPLGILALALVLPWGRAPRVVAALTAVIVTIGLPLPLAVFYHASFDRSAWFGAGDPFGQDAGFDDLAPRALALARDHDAGWIAATEYRLYAALQWQIGRDIPVVLVTQRVRFLDFKPLALPAGRALYIYSDEPDPLLAATSLTPLDPMLVTWRGEKMRTLQAALLDGFVPELNPPPGSPFYVAAP